MLITLIKSSPGSFDESKTKPDNLLTYNGKKNCKITLC